MAGQKIRAAGPHYARGSRAARKGRGDAGAGRREGAVQEFVTTGAEGDATFGFTLGAALPAGRSLTAKATGKGGTPEFSEPRQVVRQ